MRYTVTSGGATWTVDIDGSSVRVDGAPVEVSREARGAIRRITLGGTSLEVAVARGDGAGSWVVTSDGNRLLATVWDERRRAISALAHKHAAHDGPLIVRAPMPGLVVRVLAAPGQVVAAGQGLVVVEAMKMENELKAPAEGVVEAVEVAAGARVEKGAALVRLAPGPRRSASGPNG